MRGIARRFAHNPINAYSIYLDRHPKYSGKIMGGKMLTFITSFLFSHLSVLLGYGICVLFPVPWLNSSIISVWQSIGSKIMDSVRNALPASFAKVEAEVSPTTNASVSK